MSEISPNELYELYLDTVARCSSRLLSQSDMEVEYELFEEFDVGAHSFLHDDNLARLRHASYINDEIVALSREVRERWLALTESRSVQEVRTKREWRELFGLCDRILAITKCVGPSETENTHKQT